MKVYFQKIKSVLLGLLIVTICWGGIYFCAPAQEALLPIFSPIPGAYTASSIDQECRDMVLKNVSEEVSENFQAEVKGKYPLILIEGIKAPRTQEVLEYLYRSLLKLAIPVYKNVSDDELEKVGSANLMIVYPVVDGVDFISSVEDEKFYNRMCKVILHIRLTESRTGRIIFIKDFSQTQTIKLGLEKRPNYQESN
jgi:hypothetical protein